MADKIKNDNMIDEDDIITLLNDKGEEVEFFHVATIDYKKNWYVFLQPVEVVEDIAEDEVLIFRLGEDEKGEETLLPIESEEELNGVYEEYLKELRMKDAMTAAVSMTMNADAAATSVTDKTGGN